MLPEGPQVKDNPFLAPFDWGVSFAFKRAPLLIQAALIPASLGVLLAYLCYFYPLTTQQWFLVLFLRCSSITWLLVTAMIFCLATLRGEKISGKFLSVGQRALFSMPKVLVSYVMLIGLLYGLILLPWMLPLVAPFLLWAPLFCAAEIYAKSYRSEEEEENYENRDDEEELQFQNARMIVRKIRYFADKPIWDLGFARSIRFTTKNFLVTIQLTLLIWLSLIIPVAAVVVLGGYYYSFQWLVLEILLSFLVYSLVFCSASATFLRLLPKEAVDEIGIPAGVFGETEKSPPLRLRGWIFLILVGVMSTFGSWIVWKSLVKQNSKPPSVTSHIEEIKITPQQFIVTVQMTDEKNRFHWFNPYRVRLQVIPDGYVPLKKPELQLGDPQEQNSAGNTGTTSPLVAEPKESETPAATPTAALQDKALTQEGAANNTDTPSATEESENGGLTQPPFFEPQRIMPFATDGTPLAEGNFIPYGEPLRLVLYFDNPWKDPQIKDYPVKGLFRIFHISVFDTQEPLIEGRFGD